MLAYERYIMTCKPYDKDIILTDRRRYSTYAVLTTVIVAIMIIGIFPVADSGTLDILLCNLSVVKNSLGFNRAHRRSSEFAYTISSVVSAKAPT